MSDDWTRVASVADVPAGEVRQAMLLGIPVALYNIGGSLFATEDRCTHARAFMSDGYLEADCIECPMHQAIFHVPTGKVVKGPAKVDLRIFDVTVRDGGIYIKPQSWTAAQRVTASPDGC